MRFGSILGLLALAAAAPPPAAPRLHVLRELPGDSAQVDVAAGVLPLGHGALITGWTARAGAPPQGLLVRVDAEANVLWRREPGGTGTDLLFATHPDGRGGFVCAGFTTSAGAGGSPGGSPGGSDGWIVGIDSAGATRWERTFGGPGNERLTSLQPARDGWMAAGQTELDGNTDAWVVRLDREGGDLGAWTWGGAGTQRGLSIQPLADGGCVIAGGAGESRESSDGFVTRLGADGRPVWSHAVDGPGLQVAYHVRSRADGSLLVTGYGFVDPARDHDGFVMGLGADGRERFRRAIGGAGYDRATQSAELADGSIVTVTYTKRAGAADGDPAWRTALHGTSAAGRATWSLPAGGEGRESGHGVAASSTGLWMVAQSSPPGGGSRVLVARAKP